jgi:hypothetical protein
MHYHILWGSNATDHPSVLNISDREEAISKFIEIVKTIEGADKDPPPWEQKTLDDKTYFFRMVSPTHKYIIVYCEHNCEKEAQPQHRASLN